MSFGNVGKFSSLIDNILIEKAINITTNQLQRITFDGITTTDHK